MVRLTDRSDMTLDVYRGRKTTNQQQQQYKRRRLAFIFHDLFPLHGVLKLQCISTP